MIGALTRRFGRFDAAEDATQEALLAASLQWPIEGIPSEPRSWLIRVGYRRMIDMIRAEQALHRREARYLAGDSARLGSGTNSGAALGVDDSLHVLLLCCHPALSSTSQVALTLRAVGGLTTAEIAHAYGVTEQTMAVRISRAKQQLKKSGARFEFTRGDDLSIRVGSVMRVLYLVFNEGYTASTGDNLVRADLAAEAVRFARMLHLHLPNQAEPSALLALMLLTHARCDTRSTADGDLILLADQDRGRWDHAMIAEGTTLIERVWGRGPVSPYQLQAAIAAVHANAPTAGATDWSQIAALYLALEHLDPSGPVMLARIVAVAHAYGENRALDLLKELDDSHGLLQHPLSSQRAHAIRAHLLERSGQSDAARKEFLVAADLTANEVESRYLHSKANNATS